LEAYTKFLIVSFLLHSDTRQMNTAVVYPNTGIQKGWKKWKQT